MNYLAHAYLSFNDPEILTGNMISDFVKGKTQYTYPSVIQKGIQLHRAIDEFTDSHVATKEVKVIFAPQYRLYAGAFADVSYDYFLANDHNEFVSEEALLAFCTKTYDTLQKNTVVLPEKFTKMLPYMQTQNWLFNYRFDRGIQKSFGGVVKRSAYLKESDIAFDLFCKHKTTIEACYRAFFPELKQFAEKKLRQLINA